MHCFDRGRREKLSRMTVSVRILSVVSVHIAQSGRGSEVSGGESGDASRQQ